MGTKICEVIPFNSFKERIKLTKELLQDGFKPIKLDNCLVVYYNTII